ncbi:MAG: glycerophosphodiester phosphodiesterase [Winogradskyella sp.]|nr:glycerophosphodiester phosphodiesterase [Winogradskyella sp.]
MGCQSRTKLDVQGHRGCRGLLPENSLPAFEKAIDLGVNTLELDVGITKDSKVVVSHEPFMNPLICYDSYGRSIPDSSWQYYNLYNMSYEDIKKFDCGSKFHPKYPKQEKLKTYKPLLSDVFDLAKSKNSEVKFNIEIKSEPEYYGIFTPEPKAYVELVIEDIKKHNMLEFVNLQSFDLVILEEIKKQFPNMPVALLVDENEIISNKLKKLSYRPEIISPYFKLLTAQTIRDYQSQGFQIIPWTVNSLDDMRRMLSWNVDGIITDYPDQLIAILNN